jgi:hypothetical protein
VCEPQTSEKHLAPIRGTVNGFSRASRRRLLELFASLDVRGTRAKFITLTITEIISPKRAKQALRRFIMRLQRRYPEWSAVWRLEAQERGAPHFHLLTFNLPFIPQRDLQIMWSECTREPLSIVDIRAVRNRKHAMAYISKYIGKAEPHTRSASLENGSYLHEPETSETGRVWGYVNKEQLPFAERQEMLIEDEELAHYIRWYAQATTRGKGGRSSLRTLIYSDDAYEMFEWVVNHARSAGIEPQFEVSWNARQSAANARQIASETGFSRATWYEIVQHSGVLKASKMFKSSEMSAAAQALT